MKTLLRIVSCCLFFYLSACGHKNSSQQQVYTFVDQPELARKVFSQSTLSCEQNTACPEFVGGLTSFAAKKQKGKKEIVYEVGVCSLTLVASNLALTNRHCIPQDLQVLNADCGNRIKIKFPETRDFNVEDFDCGTIVALSEKKTDEKAAPDWAVIALVGESARPPVVLNKQGVDLEQAVNFYPVFYDLEKGEGHPIIATGAIHEVTCRTHANAMLGIPYFNKLSALFTASDCDGEIIHGNSGTGLLSSRQELIGVGSFGVEGGGYKFGGTNLACIPYFNDVIANGTCLF